MSRPKFTRQHVNDKIRLKTKWRRPKGLQSKLRLRKKGHGNALSVGYKAPRKDRGLVNGLKPVIVSNLSEIKKLDPKQHAVILKGSMGFKKQSHIIAECQHLSLKVLNFADPAKYVEERQHQMAEKKAKAEKVAKKKKTIEEKVKKEAEQEEDKQEQEKKQKDKVLTKPQ